MDFAPGTLVNALILSLTAFCVLLTGWNCYRSLPVMLERTLKQVADVALQADQKADRVLGAWAEEKLRLDGIVESMGDLRDQIEKKRARTASAAHRATRQIDLDEAQSPDDLKMQLRRQAGLT